MPSLVQFVLGHKAESYAAQLVPKQQEAARLESELAAHDKELVRELQHNAELGRTLSEREATIKSLKSEIMDMKLRMRHQGEQLRLFSFDLTQVRHAQATSAMLFGHCSTRTHLQACHTSTTVSGLRQP